MLIFTLLSIGSLSAWINGSNGSPADWFSEHGVVEDLQAALLALSMLAFLIRIPLATKPAVRVFYAGAALACASFVLREIDVEKLAIHESWILLGSVIGRNVILGSAWIVWCLMALSHRQEVADYVISILRRPIGKMFTIAATLVVAGLFFDKQLIPVANHLVWEESLELAGYAMLCLGANALELSSFARSQKSGRLKHRIAKSMRLPERTVTSGASRS